MKVVVFLSAILFSSMTFASWNRKFAECTMIDGSDRVQIEVMTSDNMGWSRPNVSVMEKDTTNYLASFRVDSNDHDVNVDKFFDYKENAYVLEGYSFSDHKRNVHIDDEGVLIEIGRDVFKGLTFSYDSGKGEMFLTSEDGVEHTYELRNCIKATW